MKKNIIKLRYVTPPPHDANPPSFHEKFNALSTHLIQPKHNVRSQSVTRSTDMPREHRSTTKRKFQQWQKSRKGLIDKIGQDALQDKEKLKAK